MIPCNLETDKTQLGQPSCSHRSTAAPPVFRAQGVLTGDKQVAASELFSGQRIHSTHGVHPKAPNKHIFQLSNRREDGILGVGPQWHNDGSFERAVFSHVGYHIIKVPENGGATSFSHLGAAFDALTPEEQETWARRVSVNSNSGVVHPLVHAHPISGRKSVYLHLGMTGAVLEMAKGVEQVGSLEHLRLLEEGEMRALSTATTSCSKTSPTAWTTSTEKATASSLTTWLLPTARHQKHSSCQKLRACAFCTERPLRGWSTSTRRQSSNFRPS